MSANMEMFPDSWETFVNNNSVKETKFGVEYIPTTKVMQAMAHYLKYQNSNEAIEEAITENPYLIMSVCQEIIHKKSLEEITQTMNDIFDAREQQLREWERALKKKQEDLNKQMKLDILYSGSPEMTPVVRDHLGGAWG